MKASVWERVALETVLRVDLFEEITSELVHEDGKESVRQRS